MPDKRLGKFGGFVVVVAYVSYLYLVARANGLVGDQQVRARGYRTLMLATSWAARQMGAVAIAAEHAYYREVQS